MRYEEELGARWTNGQRFGAVIGIWISANLLFQSFWMGLHGQPFDAAVMLDALGPLASVVVIVELITWVVVLVWLSNRVSGRFSAAHAAQASGD